MKIRTKAPKIVVASIAIVLGLGVIALVGPAEGQTCKPGFNIQERQFNPDDLDVTIASARVRGAGNPDNTVPNDNNHDGWVLARNNTVVVGGGASADLTVVFKGNTIDVFEAGFDRLIGATQCGGGSPRFNVETAADVLFLECDQPDGTVTEGPYTVTTTRTLLGGLGTGWERIQFLISVTATGDPVTATFLQVLSDSGPGAALIDNINVNGCFTGR